MRISEVLRAKGASVVTLTPAATVQKLVEVLCSEGIGSVVITDSDKNVLGVVNERTVIEALHEHGPDALRATIGEIMSDTFQVAHLKDELAETATIMTECRVRHLPVIEEGEMVGLVSIGDIVKARISQLTDERDHLEDYIRR